MCYFLYSGVFQSIVGWCEILGPLNAVMCQIPDIARGPTRYKIVVLYSEVFYVALAISSCACSDLEITWVALKIFSAVVQCIVIEAAGLLSHCITM